MTGMVTAPMRTTTLEGRIQAMEDCDMIARVGDFDEGQEEVMFRGASMSRVEIEKLKKVQNVITGGRLVSIDCDRGQIGVK